MRSGASTPEELEWLFEDAFVTGDSDMLAELFDHGALLVAGRERIEARGGPDIAQSATALCDRGYTYVAEARHVLQARETALVVAERAVNVMRRGPDGRWRYAISLLHTNDKPEGDNP
jgi:hypothetical protein